ncbi:relaxase domain-containing protein [Acidiferrimicrobium sp. IK]|uniref:MobF family relaxase n=1 Tax=Acidiferrimicrobium sp. IK TaxID=2871700 RepID=UPI0021CB26FC|nr:MobF family relaxase [Acidiferrimicrobium sp. IK]MCU4186944.1 relaxase domain-containing protein [Acidiferrimicrobium sp. IK]
MTPLTVGAAAYFLDGPEPGVWAGGSAPSLGLRGPVDARPLRRVLAGRHPTGGPLPGLRSVPHRRAGWDLTFAAPKSLSLVAALANAGDRGLVTAAHRSAVDDAVRWLAARGARVRRRGRVDVAEGFVLARYDHSRSDGGDPHLHSHVLLVNVALAGGRWSALSSSPLWPAMRPLGGVYRLALRARLREAGLDFRWRPVDPANPDNAGLLDVEGVPAPAVAAASHRRRDVAASLRGWETPEVAGRSARRAVRAASRQAPGTAGGPLPAVGGGWEAAVRGAGFGPEQAAALCASARRSPPPAAGGSPAALGGAVTEWLRARSTTFSGLDVVRAVAATSDGGMLPAEVDGWVRRFCADPDPYTGRWTTPAAGQDVTAVMALSRSPRPAPHRIAPEDIDAVRARHRLGQEEAAQLQSILGGRRGVVVVPGVAGSSRLIAQAAVLAAARDAWEAAGLTVGLVAPGAARRRWDALAGLRPPASDAAPAVLVVDRADRRPTPELRDLLERAGQSDTTVVLVEGGTLPARHHPASGALTELVDGGDRPRSDAALGYAEGMDSTEARAPAALSVTDAGRPTCAVGVGPLDAIAALADRWASAPPGARPVLVGLGPAEVEALNAEARRRREALGELDGPAIESAGRWYQAGDRVMALRRLGVASGTYGTVVGVDARGGRLRVEWPDRQATLDRHEARRLGHGYASGPARVPPAARHVLLLGDPAAVRHLQDRVVGVALVAPATRRPPRRQLDALAAALPPPDPATLAQRASRPLPVLDQQRRRLAALLMAAGPPDPAAEPRGALRQPGGWVAGHGGDLAEWRVLGDAAAWRADALARAASLRFDRHRDRRAEQAATPALERARIRAMAVALDQPRQAAQRPEAGLGLA